MNGTNMYVSVRDSFNLFTRSHRACRRDGAVKDTVQCPPDTRPKYYRTHLNGNGRCTLRCCHFQSVIVYNAATF